jgi:two-component system, OmpR family, phosphate regulon sensor histidine kinase PhoR
MSWWLVLLVAVFAACAGAYLGGQMGIPAGAWLGGLFGLAAALAAAFIASHRTAARLRNWLGSPTSESAPKGQGVWGEVGARAERRIRSLEQEVQDERRRLAEFISAMEASPGGVLLLSALDQIEWCNALAAVHFGLDPQRDRLQRVTNLIRSPAFVTYLQAGQFDEPVSFADPRGQGSLQVVIRRYGADSKLVLSRDLTERERAEAMRRDFVANVSHEMRTPLTVLTGFLETLRDLPLTPVETKRVIMLMSQQADRMTSLVGDLLTLAQLEGSPRPDSNKWVRVAGIFSQVEAEARALSAGRHIILFGDAKDAQIAGSESELTSAVANLVNNAVRYTLDGGSVSVAWICDKAGQGEICVADTGRGVAREHLPRLTERFYRVDVSRARDSGGTGLGLAIVKHVAQRHGAELDITSELGRGSTFRLLLPPARVRHLVPESMLPAETP